MCIRDSTKITRFRFCQKRTILSPCLTRGRRRTGCIKKYIQDTVCAFAIPCQARDSSIISTLEHPLAAVTLFTIENSLFTCCTNFHTDTKRFQFSFKLIALRCPYFLSLIHISKKQITFDSLKTRKTIFN